MLKINNIPKQCNIFFLVPVDDNFNYRKHFIFYKKYKNVKHMYCNILR